MESCQCIGNDTDLVLCVKNLPKELQINKIKKLFNQLIGENNWKIRCIYPLENRNMVEIECTCQEVYNKINNKQHMIDNYKIKNFVITINPYTAINIIEYIDYDCLHMIFKKCALKEQIALTKVCKFYYNIIIRIWKIEFKCLKFKIYDFKFVYLLSPNDLEDFFLIIGPYVEKIIFDTFYNVQVIDKSISRKYSGSSVTRGIKYMNKYFCQYLMNFPNLKSFEVHGVNLSEFTIKQLSLYCPKITKFKLCDTGSERIDGSCLYLCQDLEELSIENTPNFERFSLTSLCRNVKLKLLNFTDCNHLQDPIYITKLCKYLNDLVSLSLTAISHDNMIEAILKLENLKYLQFSWPSSVDDFEEKYFWHILKLRNNSLKDLQFINDRVYNFNSNQSQSKSTEYYNTMTREHNSIKGKPWKLAMSSHELVHFFSSLTQLETITFEYCRIFKMSFILSLPIICTNLKCIKLIGCREPTDIVMQKEWNHRCKLEILGKIPVELLQIFRNNVESTNEEVLRSLKSEFG